MEVPNPIFIEINKGEADIKQVLKDILALTKLNYNACIFADGVPVTLRFADKIGEIETALINSAEYFIGEKLNSNAKYPNIIFSVDIG